MNPDVKRCVELHLAGKAKPHTAIDASAWFDAAARHIDSATAIINSDADGALLLCWSAMHKSAKGIAAGNGLRIEDETHGKVVDFLVCVLAGSLDDTQKGLVRATQLGRNIGAYERPGGSMRLVGQALNLANHVLRLARVAAAPEA